MAATTTSAVGEHLRQAIKRRNGTLKPSGQAHRARRAAIGHKQCGNAALVEGRCGQLGRLTCADDDHVAAREIADLLLCHLRGK